MKERYQALTLNQKKGIAGFIFVLPWIIGFLVLFLKPIIETFIYSFHYISPSDEGMSMESVGFDNFIYLFRDFTYELQGEVYPFLRLMYESVSSTLIELPIIVVISLLMAVLLNQKFKGRGLARTVFFLPIIFGLGVLSNLNVSTAMGDALEETIQAQRVFEFFDISFLFEAAGIPETVMDILYNAVSQVFSIIAFSGVQILIFLSALQSINPTLYEVAKIEGSTTYETFWKVTVPMISPIFLTVVVYTFVDTMYRSPITQVITDTAFRDLQAGPGVSSAISVIFLFITMFLLTIMILIVRKGVHYND